VSQTKAQLLEGKTDQDVNAKTIALAGATSGTATISATAIAGTPTLTLPSVSGTIDRLNRAGNILQVVSTSKASATFANEISAVASTTYVTGGFSTNITPTSASSKILLQFNGVSYSSGGVVYRLFAFFKSSTNISNTLVVLGGNDYSAVGFSFLDSPASTSALTYSVGIAGYTTTGTHYLTQNGTLTLMEVAA
jgi:hypothetical protein